MGDDSSLSILLFAIVAFVLARMLWQVLGRNDGDTSDGQPRPDPFRSNNLRAQGAQTGAGQGINPIGNPTPPLQPSGYDQVSLDGWLRIIRAADPRFDERQFLAGAKAAFGIIVTAFSSGDRAALKPMLADDVMLGFDQAIAAREAEGQRLETTIVKISADIDQARLAADMARITVAFHSSQTSVLYGREGEMIDGDPKRIEDVLDIWVFARDMKSSDPNWLLVETRQA